MRNKDGLTHKEFLFCEELLRNGFVVDAAYKTAYPNDKGRNGNRVLKKKEVIAYIHKRRQEKEATLDVLLDKAHQRLASIIMNGDDRDATKAIEILFNSEAKLNNAIKPQAEESKGITININSVDSNKEENKI